MCTVCGCGEGNVKIEGQHTHAHSHHEDAHHDHSHSEHTHHYGHDDNSIEKQGEDLHFGKGPAHAHVAGMSQSRMVQIEQDILGKNDRYAQINRARFEAQSLFVLNLVSSPGSGKTTLLTETINRLKESRKVAVIEGDQQTANDADRIRETGVPAVQVNTGKGCHLDAHMVGHALDNLDDLQGGFLFIENVGNLVCPAAFDLGEAHKIAILSVTEGEDKPLKYPDMFHAADIMILNKTDLLPHLDFDVDKCIEFARQVNPDIKVLKLSAKSGEGMQEWQEWLEENRKGMIQTRIDQLKSEIQQFEALL
ncbi:hydrogenase nickel incorporation protein HypB [Neptuniibacter sp. QD29_5]|uniref:hydrogenase nickel incorporation protein HypB n=1 Tax=Neptuniibacter sp. QD29_5 TaxID=3398207 RepID=UPI0039F551D5